MILSYRTLKVKTGRQSEAVARAIAALKAKGLIHSPGQSAKFKARFSDRTASETERQQYKDI